ncbi:MAG TPA: response regulator [Alphaproteobacteria bacterium]
MSLAVETIRIFVIDDNDFMREAIAAMLREIGFRDVFQAQDGDDALRQLEQANPALIICDINMKPMDGFQFVEALRAHAWPNAASVPVIFLTSHTEPSIVKRAVRLGVEAYVVKPVEKKRLEARVLTVLENALTRRA